MTPFDRFDQVLSGFERMEESQFLGATREFAGKNPGVVDKAFSLLLKNRDLHIKLKYLIIKSIGELKYENLVPALKESLEKEDNLPVITAAVNTLAAIGTLPAYKVLLDLKKKRRDPGYKKKIAPGLSTMFSRDRSVYHFDVFYRERESVRDIEKSSDFIIRHLPDDYIADLLPGTASRYYKIRYETMRILAHRPHPGYYSTIFDYFKENAQTEDDEFFLMMASALVANAFLVAGPAIIFQQLKVHLQQLKGYKRDIFCILLLKLNTREMIPQIRHIYPNLKFEEKSLLFEYLNPVDYNRYVDFLHGLLNHENNEAILEKIVEISIRANDYEYLFKAVDREKGLRKHKLLHIILDRSGEGIDHYVREYVALSQENSTLALSLDYLLKYCADKYFDLIMGIFFSGVSTGIKVHILRNVHRFGPHRQTSFMESIFKDLAMVRDFKKEFLQALLGVMNAGSFTGEMEEKILNRVLVLMEEAPNDELADFIYFFDNYRIDNPQHGELIIDELRLVRYTLLKSSAEPGLVRAIQSLTRNMERKMVLKKINLKEKKITPSGQI